MTKTKYSHIRTFKDFESEKIELHYQIRLSEKKLQIKQLELKEYLNPIRFFTSIFSDLYRPAFDLIKTVVMHFIDKKKKPKKEKKDSTSGDKSKITKK